MSTLTIADRPTFGPLPEPNPGPKAGTYGWQHIVDALAERPGEWAAIGSLTTPGSIGRRGQELRRRGVQVAQRSNGDGTATLYGRYVGIEQAEASKAERTSHRAVVTFTPPTPVVMHALDFRLPAGMPGPLVWAPPAEVAS